MEEMQETNCILLAVTKTKANLFSFQAKRSESSKVNDTDVEKDANIGSILPICNCFNFVLLGRPEKINWEQMKKPLPKF